MLGYQVGYVSNISVVNNDEVFVTFIITDKKVTMPERIAATIEFTGMGGSKSLELVVPEEKTDDKNFITTIEPRRLQDFYFYQSEIAQNIVSMASDFMKICTDHNTKLAKDFIKKPALLYDSYKKLDSIESTETKLMKKRRKQ
jgi:predicted ATPase